MTNTEIFNLTPLQALRPKARVNNDDIRHVEKRLDWWVSNLFYAQDKEKWFLKLAIETLRKRLSKLETKRFYINKRISILKRIENGEQITAPEEFDIERIKKDVRIENVLGEPVARTQNKAWYLCPYHNEKTSSFCWNEDKHYFKCFGCGKAGDILTIYMHINNCNFYEALRSLG